MSRHSRAIWNLIWLFSATHSYSIDTTFVVTNYYYDRVTSKLNIHDNSKIISGSYLNGLIGSNLSCHSEMDANAKCYINIFERQVIPGDAALQTDTISLGKIKKAFHDVESIRLIQIEHYSRGWEVYRSLLIAGGVLPISFIVEAAALPFTKKYNWKRPLILSSAIVVAQFTYTQIVYQPIARKIEVNVHFK